MAKLYIGDSKVGSAAVITEVEVEKKKFGVGVDAFLGDIDENGVYTNAVTISNKYYDLDLSKIKELKNNFYYKFAYSCFNNIHIPDCKSSCNSSFAHAFKGCKITGKVVIETSIVDSNYMFSNAFESVQFSETASIVFKNLETVKPSKNVPFDSAFGASNIFTYHTLDDIFPELTELGGEGFYRLCDGTYGDSVHTMRLSKLKRVIKPYQYYPPLGLGSAVYSIELPELQEISGGKKAFDGYLKELHFAKKYQTEIEACEGYSTKFGATYATIYFDL